MGQRRDEFEIGSDSFLDVVCNMVGILVILMVIAGIHANYRADEDRAREQAVRAVVEGGATPVDDESAREAPIVEAVPDELSPEPEVAETAMPGPSELPVELAPAEPRGPSPELLEQAEAMERDLALLASQAEKDAAALAREAQKEQALRERLAQLEQRLRAAATAVETMGDGLAARQAAINVTAEELAEARRQLEALEKAKPASQQIEHRVTPVSRTVIGSELHFHLAGGKVSVVPLDDLTDQLRTQVLRQKEWLSKYRRHQGEVGPISGFSMRYVVERAELSVVDELRQGGSMMKIGVSQWQLIPDAKLNGETAEQALRTGSKFQRALRQAKADAALTFWVYPDSFALYRDLTAFAHKYGFTVAARPLPDGVPIAGSPNGSRSSGQ